MLKLANMAIRIRAETPKINLLRLFARSCRRYKSSNPMSAIPARIFRNPRSFPSASARKSPAKGSNGYRNAGGKHSSASSKSLLVEALGSPSTIRARTFSSPCIERKSSISLLTHFDLAEFGEQRTIRNRDCFNASSMTVPNSAEPANSSRSRNTGRMCLPIFVPSANSIP